jgi:signal transduction histidine kinase
MKAANEMLESLRASIEQTNTMALGDYTADIVPRSEKDDLGKAMKTLSRTLRETSQVAEEVAGGNYKAIMEVKGDNDLLSISVNKMTRSLSVAISELEEQISERRKTQSQLIQAEKFSAIGQLGSGLAHELNSPLDGLLTMLRIRRDKACDDEHKKLSIMVDAAEHMAKIIRDFGSFSGKSSGKFSKIDTKDVIESTLSFSGIHLLKHDIKITRDYDNNHLDILGDKSQLQQVVLNIFTNARDAMPHGGEFVIRTRNSENGGKVIMEFIDTGVGIKEEDLPRIFDTFFTTKEQGKGIGLGLSISYGIIKSHNGEILVESPPNGQTGKGTKFTISLPALKTRKGNNNGKG